MNCRHCNNPLTLPFLDLGAAPPSNAYLTLGSLSKREIHYPLKVLACDKCWLVQTEDTASADELFDAEYAYYSSCSASWVAHAEAYVSEMQGRLGLDASSHVVEVAANDGYLLQFVQQRGIPCTGVEPTAGTAAAARAKGISVIGEFFGLALAEKMVGQGLGADLTAANNVLAHVPDINDFVSGFARLLKPHGVATFEFPHLLNLIGDNQFDTVYHEHFSYLSLTAVARVFATNGLRVFDVQEIPTHGGSLRVFAGLAGNAGNQPELPSVNDILSREESAGLTLAETYSSFQSRAETVKDDFLAFLIEAKRQGKTVAAYGAAAKGNTLMNFAGIRGDLISFVADINPAKQGKFMPGSRIPIVEPSRIMGEKPDYIVILPWNLREEVIAQLHEIRGWGGSFVTAVPRLAIHSLP
ncbi:methyltransferase domain-containing protein [Akkermansiaceae bacterium]|nr:methyltransferase domain-containing protein [Akkermansiaceae bacterium]